MKTTFCNRHLNLSLILIHSPGAPAKPISQTHTSLSTNSRRRIRRFKVWQGNFSYKMLRQLNIDNYFCHKGSSMAPLILPYVHGEKRRICYTITEYDPLLDSSNMTFKDWERIAEDIQVNYSD